MVSLSNTSSSALSNGQRSEKPQKTVKKLSRGATIGIIGGGQLGQMMALSARYMGFKVGLLDPAADCPAAGACDFQIVAAYDDHDAIARIAQMSDVLTYEFENVDAGALDAVADMVDIPQGTDLLRVTQNRVAEKTFINAHGIRTAQWKQVTNAAELVDAVDAIGLPAVLKTASGGYDGHGQKVLRTNEDVHEAAQEWGSDFPQSIVEGFVDFAYEASILVSGNGTDFVTFPLVKNDHVNNILHTTIAPASAGLGEVTDADKRVADTARELALTIAKGFKLAGTLAIELFVTADGEVIVNELAPRPHNSGHYTIEACDYDQFDAHVRGIAGWALSEPQLLKTAVMINVLGQHLEPVFACLDKHPSWHMHDYGKTAAKYNRKMGHITVVGDDIPAIIAEFNESGCWE